MSDLTTWLRAQLDDDERANEGTGVVGWLTYRRADGSIAYTIPAALAEDGETWIAVGAVAKDYASAEIVHREGQVKAEIDAKLRIVALHRTYMDYGDSCEICRHPYDDLAAGAPWPCTTLRLLALPYAGRPGYREEWRH